MPVTSVLGRQREEDPCEFEASLVYASNSRSANEYIVRSSLNKQNQGWRDGSMDGMVGILPAFAEDWSLVSSSRLSGTLTPGNLSS